MHAPDRKRLRRIFRWGLAVGSVVVVVALLGTFDGPELKALDARFLLRGPQQPASPIVIVAIDDNSFQELYERGAQWPWPRSWHAELIDRLSRGRPRLIGFDILFTEPSRFGPQDDRAFADAIRRAGNVVLAAHLSWGQIAAEGTEGGSVVGAKESLDLPLPLLRDQAAGYGFVNMSPDTDAFIRRAQITRSHQGRPEPSFVTRLFELASGVQGKAQTDEPVLINFRGPVGTFPTIPYYQVLLGEVGPETFAGKIILVGSAAPSLQDLFPTPFAAQQRMLGVEIQANLLETLLQKIALIHPPLLFHLFVVMVWALVAACIGFLFRPLKGFGLVAGLSLVYGLAAVAAFVWFRVWLDIVAPSTALFTTYGAVVLRNYIQEEGEKRRLSRYFSPAVLDEIVRHPEKMSLGSARRRATILFSDIRGFTSISEQLPPEEVVELLREYLTAMTEIVFKHGGVVDKFIGDAIMALYGVPLSYEDHAARAVRTALEMQAQTAALATRWADRCGAPLRIGVGIHTGEVVVGTMGSAQRLEYTAIGDTVNLTSRLEGMTKDLNASIVISQDTKTEIEGLFDVRRLGQVKVRGRETPVEVYTVVTEANAD
ncbi:adenylate/guanylate cyclase domain-containing protein [Candidatus Methylomirabilis sp.]|uniref:CHASE2 domain-containing protein n=1 Tax=Candidatus Methylomirabilis sp. TaxID=2032687 RepID=UPI002A5E23F2|nr:adenylate/guanylate cyclase domain-containing protein [Candidatus Methylomirabilis sp.]